MTFYALWAQPPFFTMPSMHMVLGVVVGAVLVLIYSLTKSY